MRLFKIAVLGTAFLSAQVLATIAATAAEAAEAMTIAAIIAPTLTQSGVSMIRSTETIVWCRDDRDCPFEKTIQLEGIKMAADCNLENFEAYKYYLVNFRQD
ncbi:hypothetical protein E4U19_006381 [Claviceps sp. Clav32 group G5]|nr:hypothetical protein E4U19_006381 [Claviceps sp. Clav32 group G5]